jgi:hypothetical protein
MGDIATQTSDAYEYKKNNKDTQSQMNIEKECPDKSIQNTENDSEMNGSPQFNMSSDDIKKMLGFNIIRKLTNTFKKSFGRDFVIGSIYYSLHQVFIFFIGFISTFSFNIVFLSAILVIVSMDALSIVVLHDCPLTMMEKKYLGTSICEHRNIILKELGISYRCDHIYEQTIELLINVWMLISMKICLIILFRMFRVDIMTL